MKTSIDSVQSIAIRSEYENAHCNHAEYFGTFAHPEHPDSRDWMITLYRVCDTLVFETNGDPVWQNCAGNYCGDGFDLLIAEYGIDLQKEVDA
jgi:hypothetical protein